MKPTRTALIALILSHALISGAWAEPSEIVYQTVAMEASNQGEVGQYLVASVIVNRAKERGQALEGVCLARKQFSAWNDRQWAKTWLDKHYTPKTRLRASNALERAIMGPYKGVNHYHTKAVRPYWAKGKKPTLIYGDHVFYRL